MTPTSAPALRQMCPFFIVSNVDRTITFYRETLGFDGSTSGATAGFSAGVAAGFSPR